MALEERHCTSFHERKVRRVPDLHAFTPVAHVFPKQQVVGGCGSYEVEDLLKELSDERRVETVCPHQVNP